MAGRTGTQKYWPTAQNVNISTGNLLLIIGSGSCVTCGGGGSQAYPSTQSTTLNGPVLVYNTWDTPSTDFGDRWMLNYDAKIVVPGDPLDLYDCDGTKRHYEPEDPGDVWISTTDADEKITKVSDEYILHRYNGDKWYFFGSGANVGKLKRVVSRTEHQITITRDGNGRIEKIADGQGRETKLFYVSTGGQTRLSEYREPAPGDVGWQSTFFTYDSSSRLVGITNPMGETTRFEYNGSALISKAIDGHGHATEYTYDGSSRVTNVKDPANNNTVIAYTSSTVRTVTNRISKVTTYTFDSDGKVTKIADALGTETEFEYASSTEVTAIYGPKIPSSGTPWSRHKTILTYGTGTDTHELAKSEVKKITNTDSTGTLLAKNEWTYNTFHDVLTHKNPLDKITTYTYKLDAGSNSVGLVGTVVNPLSQTVLTNTYDTAANKYRLLISKNGVNKETTFAYNQNTANSYGTPDRITTPLGNITNYKVDVRGRKYEMTDPSGNPVKFDFDVLDRMVRTTYPDGTTTGSLYDCCHLSADYDQNGFVTTYEYDVMGNLTRKVDQNGEETEFTFNAEGWRLTSVDPRGKTTTNTYDDIGRVTQVEYPGAWKEIFTYFEPGMVKTKKNEKGATSTTVTYEYDDLYRLKKKDFPSGTDSEFETDAAGRLTKVKDASGEKRYTYDDADRLTKILEGPQGFVDGTNQNYKLEYTWNAASQR